MGCTTHLFHLRTGKLCLRFAEILSPLLYLIRKTGDHAVYGRTLEQDMEAGWIQAIALCGKHPEALRYRETIFDAYIFLGRIYDMAGEYVKAEDAFTEAEKRVHDSPYEWKLPLCPKEIREKAKMMRSDRKTE